jgi:hypothetical protein
MGEREEGKIREEGHSRKLAEGLVSNLAERK